jgi:hypothetical protein
LLLVCFSDRISWFCPGHNGGPQSSQLHISCTWNYTHGIISYKLLYKLLT